MERKSFSRSKNNEKNKKPVRFLFTSHMENAKRSRNIINLKKLLVNSNLFYYIEYDIEYYKISVNKVSI